jgi:hypothetical protein
MAWITRWLVRSRTTNKIYTVAMKEDGSWGCDCPAWKFAKAPKPDCKHILATKRSEPEITPGVAGAMAGARAAMRQERPLLPPQPAPNAFFVTQTRRTIVFEED